jgi:hypothetical protein
MATLYPLKTESDEVVEHLANEIQNQRGLIESADAVQNYTTFLHYRLTALSMETMLEALSVVRREALGAIASYQERHTVSHFTIVKSVNLLRPGEFALLLYLSKLNTIAP